MMLPTGRVVVRRIVVVSSPRSMVRVASLAWMVTT